MEPISILTNSPDPSLHRLLNQDPRFEVVVETRPRAFVKILRSNPPHIVVMSPTPDFQSVIRRLPRFPVMRCVWADRQDVVSDKPSWHGVIQASDSADTVGRILDTVLRCYADHEKALDMTGLLKSFKLLHSSLEMDKTFQAIVAILAELLQARSVSFFMADYKSQELAIRASLPDSKKIGERVQFGDGTVGKVGLSGKLMKTKSYICLPLKTDYGVLGVIYVSHKLGQAQFNARDVRLLQEMGQQIIGAIENVKIFSAVGVLAAQDGLTKLFSRTYFQKKLPEEVQRANAQESTLSLLMLDIDYFKSINDTYGHMVGDQVLRRVGAVVRQSIRTGDFAARYGGEEMVAILVGAPRDQACQIAERLRKRVEALQFYSVTLKADDEDRTLFIERIGDDDIRILVNSGGASDEDAQSVESLSQNQELIRQLKRPPSESGLKFTRVKVTASIGVSAFPEDFGSQKGASRALMESTETQDVLIYMADKALYKAKRNGRNQSLSYQEVQTVLRSSKTKPLEKELVNDMLKKMLEKDDVTYYHLLRVGRISELIAEKLGLDGAATSLARMGGILHDIGKLFIPDAVLKKPDRLTEEEYELMKSHVTLGMDYIEGFPVLRRYIHAVRSHHENWLGGGYPDGISQTQIPLEARIIKVADTYDAITVDRHYSKANEDAEAYALNELQKFDELLFDSQVLKAFFAALTEIQDVKKQSLNQWLSQIGH